MGAPRRSTAIGEAMKRNAGGESGYLAYMLRLRRVVRDGQPVWQASVESPHTGESHAFASLEALYAFLVAATRASTTGDVSESGTQAPRAEEGRVDAI